MSTDNVKTINPMLRLYTTCGRCNLLREACAVITVKTVHKGYDTVELCQKCLNEMSVMIDFFVSERNAESEFTMAYPTDYESEERDANYFRDRKKDDDATNKWAEQVAKVRAALARVIKQDAIDPWLRTKNDVFGCRPIDMVGSHREHEIYRMIERFESGEPA